MLLYLNLFADDRYAFIYSKNIDDTFINFYDKVIVEADEIDDIYAFRYPNKMVAYVSIGEIEPWRKTKKKYEKSWVISKNKTWNSLIGDLRKEDYQKFVLKRVETLYKRGYRNFFLDTMDSYHVTAKDEKLFKEQQKALIAFIHRLHKEYPNSKLIINRGFELLEEIHSDIYAVVAESLIARYNHSKKEYLPVPQKDRDWLLENLLKAKSYGLDVISIDYSNKGTKERQDIAKKIKELGVIPYVTDGLLQNQGECEVNRLRRDILILFNRSALKDNSEVYSDAHLLISMPIEYYGYIPKLYDISSQELPKDVETRYHAVLIWSYGETENNKKLYEWAKDVKERGVKILFINNFVFEPTDENLKTFGLKTSLNRHSILDKSRTIYHKPYRPFEMRASIEFKKRLINPIKGRGVVSLKYRDGQKDTPIAIMPWGGYALGNSYLLRNGDNYHWTIDIFRFLKDTLRLDTTLVPDPTTEAGRRVLFVHVEGNGFVERVRSNIKKFSPERLIEYIYQKYKIPQSVSITQKKVNIISPKIKEVAKKLYAIPWIEPASNAFSLKQELKRSVDFTLSFAPKQKKKEKIIFWNRDSLPSKKVLSYIEKHNILGINGGDTTIDRAKPWISHIAPFGLQRDEYWQIYTSQQSEVIYTNYWSNPFWGFRDVIDTFKKTEEPKRLKAMDIHYHLYSGSRVASLQALDEVYSWAMREISSKLYASQYIKKVRGFYRTSISKLGANRYEIRNSGELRTIRVDKRVKVNLLRSVGVAGFNYKKSTTYITLDSRDRHIIAIGSNHPKLPYLIDMDGWIERVEYSGDNSKFKIRTNMSIEANFFVPKSCRLKPINGFKTSYRENILSINSINSSRKGATIEFKCK